MKTYTLEPGRGMLSRTYTVRDEKGTAVYTVAGRGRSILRQMTVLDAQGREAASFRRTGFPPFSRYEVEIPGQPLMEIAKERTLLRPRYSVRGPGWDVEGEERHREFTIRSVSQSLAVMIRSRQSATIKVEDESRTLALLTVALVVEYSILDARAVAAASARS